MVYNHGKQQNKQVFPLSRVFLANLIPGHAKVPYNCVTRPVPSESQNLEPFLPCIHPDLVGPPGILTSLSSFSRGGGPNSSTGSSPSLVLAAAQTLVVAMVAAFACPSGQLLSPQPNITFRLRGSSGQALDCVT